jgi:hypothetical protein
MMERFSALSREQGKAVLGFLKYMSGVSEGIVDSRVARQAIEAYWKRFE